MQRVRQVPSGGLARRRRVASANRIEYRDVLGLDAVQISGAQIIAFFSHTDHLAGDDEVTQKLQQLRKRAIPRRGEDSQMKLEAGVDRLPAALDLGVDRRQRLLDFGQVVA